MCKVQEKEKNKRMNPRFGLATRKLTEFYLDGKSVGVQKGDIIELDQGHEL